MPRFHKHEIARRQLETAVDIFLRGADLSSAITLAGAASGILDNLVKRSGREPFVDYARRVHAHIAGFTPKRQSYLHHIEKVLGIIAHKHLAKSDPETVELDLQMQAVHALQRAVADYITLNGQEDPFIKGFLGWCWKNMDGPGLMEKYKDVPVNVRKSK